MRRPSQAAWGMLTLDWSPMLQFASLNFSCMQQYILSVCIVIYVLSVCIVIYVYTYLYYDFCCCFLLKVKRLMWQKKGCHTVKQVDHTMSSMYVQLQQKQCMTQCNWKQRLQSYGNVERNICSCFFNLLLHSDSNVSPSGFTLMFHHLMCCIALQLELWMQILIQRVIHTTGVSYK